MIISQNNQDLLNLKKISIFLIIFFFSRVIIYYNHINHSTLDFNSDYLNALNDNFLEYFFYFHSLPIGNILIAKIYLIFSNILELKTFYYLLNCFYSLISFLIVMKILKGLFEKLDLHIYLLFLIYVLAIIQYETWRIYHHDHINILIFTYLIYFFYDLIFAIKKNSIHFIIIFILFSIFYSGALSILIQAIIIILFISIINKKKFNKIIIIFSILILSFNILILFKNYQNIKIFSPTSVMNSVLLQRIHHSLGYEKFKQNLNKSDLSIHLQKCIENIYSIKSQNKNYFENITLFKCFQNKNNTHYDYQKIIILFENLKVNKEIINQIKKDKNEAILKSWKFSGGYQEYNERTGHIFQFETKKIFFNSLINYPFEILLGSIGSKGILLTFIQSASWGGMLPNYYESNAKIQNILFNIINVLLAIINIFFVLFFIYNLIKQIFIKKNYSIFKNNIFQFNLIIIFFIFGFLTMNSIITCCENPRMTVMVSSLFMINTLINLKNISNHYL